MQYFDILVLGPNQKTRRLATGLHRAGLRACSRTATEIWASPGIATNITSAILLWSPGKRPALELQLRLAGLNALHANWDSQSASVGPFTAAGHGPCLSCLAQKDIKSGPGDHPATEQWAIGWAVAHTLGVLNHSTSDLVGSSLHWSLAKPGLQIQKWPPTADCPDCNTN